MAYGRKWKPNKAAAKEFAEQMDRINTYCKENDISRSLSSDSYYFSFNGTEYRVSNHAVEKSVSAYGEHYHGDSKEYREKVFCIHASKTRLIEIHQLIVNGTQVDHHGKVV